MEAYWGKHWEMPTEAESEAEIERTDGLLLDQFVVTEINTLWLELMNLTTEKG